MGFVANNWDFQYYLKRSSLFGRDTISQQKALGARKKPNVSSQTAEMDLKFLLVTTMLVGMAQSSLNPPEEMVELCRFMDCDATLERQG